MQRSRTVLLGLVVAAAAGGLAWWALRGGSEFPGEPEPRDVASAGPVVGTLDPLRQAQAEHQDRWPFADYEKDLGEIRVPEQDEDERRRANQLKVYFELVDVDFNEATMDDVVLELNRQLKHTGVKVFTIPNGDMDGTKFTFSVKDVEVQVLIGQLIAASKGRMSYYITSQGLCLGSPRAVERCQIDARETLAKQRAEGDRNDPILTTQFRPEFSDHRISAVIRSIREQTGVQVVTDAPTWQEAKTLTWSADPMPLRDALDKICAELHVVYRVRGGRVFLCKP